MNTSTFALIQRLFTVRRTLTKMLQRRGYVVPPDVANDTAPLFESRWLAATAAGESPELSFTVSRDRDDLLMVFFPGEAAGANVGIAPIREYIERMDAARCVNAIVVVSEGLTSPAVTMLRELELKGYYIAAFAEVELLVDIYEHHKVPLHVVLTAGEKVELLKSLKIEDDLLPKMQRHDPMARYLGLRVGDVVRIHRVSMTVAHDIYYRIVVDSEDFD